MQIEYTGRHTEVSKELRLLAERKLRKLARVLPRITHVHVVLARGKHRQSAEVSVQSSRRTLTAAEESADMAVSLSTVMDKLARQAERYRGKLLERKRRAAPRTVPPRSAVEEPGEQPDVQPRVFRRRRFVAKAMTVVEAMREVEAGEDGVLVFRDAATKRMSVLFKRKDGHLGLIEPEA